MYVLPYLEIISAFIYCSSFMYFNKAFLLTFLAFHVLVCMFFFYRMKILMLLHLLHDASETIIFIIIVIVIIIIIESISCQLFEFVCHQLRFLFLIQGLGHFVESNQNFYQSFLSLIFTYAFACPTFSFLMPHSPVL